MNLFSLLMKIAFAITIGMFTFCAAPAAAQTTPPRLLFLGISKDGRANLAVESAVRRRLGGLAVLLTRVPELSCAQADCLAPALALEHADLALAGSIRRNEHACLATLWLAANKQQERPIEKDIVCRAGWEDDEFNASMADGAAELIDSYLRSIEPAHAPNAFFGVADNVSAPQTFTDKKSRWSLRKKILFTTLGVLLAGGLAATVSLASIPPAITQCSEANCFNIMSFRPAVAAAGVLSGAAAASMLFISIK